MFLLRQGLPERSPDAGKVRRVLNFFPRPGPILGARRIEWSQSEVTSMCFNNGNNNCSCLWLIIIVVLICCCCGSGNAFGGSSCGCGCGCGNDNCGNGCC